MTNSPTQMIEGMPMDDEFGGNAKNLVVLIKKPPNSVIVAHESTYKGTEMFSIREVYMDYTETWKPGKGVTVPATKKKDLLDALYRYIMVDTKPSGESVKAVG